MARPEITGKKIGRHRFIRGATEDTDEADADEENREESEEHKSERRLQAHQKDRRAINPQAKPRIRILDYEDLKSKGIRFSRQWIDKLIAKGLFPRKVYIGEATVGFVEHEVDAYLESKIAERDGEAAAQKFTEAEA
jgi:prophage regulatory protein